MRTARTILLRYMRRKIARRFARVMARGIDRLDPWGPRGGEHRPLILVANHSSWWDAVVPIFLSLDLMGHDAHGFMESQGLRRYPFFRRLGMLPLDRDNSREAIRQLETTTDLIRRRRKVLWIFPQGRIVPNDRRPIVAESGTARLIELLGECAIAPVALRYDVGPEEFPIAYVSVGDVVDPGFPGAPPRKELTDRIGGMIERELDALRDDMMNERLEEFVPVLHGRSSVNTKWDRVRISVR